MENKIKQTIKALQALLKIKQQVDELNGVYRNVGTIQVGNLIEFWQEELLKQ